MAITREELKVLIKDLNDENIYNFRNFKKQLDKFFGEGYLNMYVGLFEYIFKKMNISSDSQILNATDEQLDEIVAFINNFKDKRNMDFVYESHM